jgi:hypothetical protein
MLGQFVRADDEQGINVKVYACIHISVHKCTHDLLLYVCVCVTYVSVTYALCVCVYVYVCVCVTYVSVTYAFVCLRFMCMCVYV